MIARSVPALRSFLKEPLWDQFRVLLPERPPVAATHPLGCHRRPIPDRVVFEHAVVAFGAWLGLRADREQRLLGSDDSPPPQEWAGADLAQTLHTLVFGSELPVDRADYADIVVDGCITKAHCGGAKAGRSRWIGASTASSARWRARQPACACTSSWPEPIGTIRHSWSRLWTDLAQLGTLPEERTMHLDRGYASHKSRRPAGRTRLR